MTSRPKVAVSACLLGRPVRYDGAQKHDPTVTERLACELTLVQVCPELELGLGVPRPPGDVIVREGEARLWMPARGLRDRGARSARGAGGRLSSASEWP